MWVDKVWIFVMFDLPTESPKQKKAYQLFRKEILKYGFSQFQYSIYTRYCDTDEEAKKHINRVKNIIPDAGKVNILKVTDKQMDKMVTISNNDGGINKDLVSSQVVLL